MKSALGYGYGVCTHQPVSSLKQALSALLVTVVALSAMDYYFWGEAPAAEPGMPRAAAPRAAPVQPLHATLHPDLSALQGCPAEEELPTPGSKSVASGLRGEGAEDDCDAHRQGGASLR